MSLRRPKRHDVDELRAKFVANREKVRSWAARWECPEVEWPAFSEVPGPWAIAPREQNWWLRRHAPFMDEYRWLLEARPVAQGINELWASWEFGAGHEFERLAIRFRSVIDPDYLAEKLALGIRAAALKGWQDDDVHDLYDWLREGVNQGAEAGMVRGKHRTGFLLCEMTCTVVSRTEAITAVRTTLTDTTLDGVPLNADGRT
ncbi:hypothetical protein ACFQ7F_01140 [Streptomyces sp. NPDC056486]|uniref:hypothetical protein n=1 Tax=Streptomyces sp. NPDC056486 TaxID=3345835 RepID=UPI0036C61ECB